MLRIRRLTEPWLDQVVQGQSTLLTENSYVEDFGKIKKVLTDNGLNYYSGDRVIAVAPSDAGGSTCYSR